MDEPPKVYPEIFLIAGIEYYKYLEGGYSKKYISVRDYNEKYGISKNKEGYLYRDGHKPTRIVYQYDKDRIYIQTFNSLNEAAVATKVNYLSLCNLLYGKTKKNHQEYIWSFEKLYDHEG